MRLHAGGSLAAYADYLFQATPDGDLEMLFAETPPRPFQRFALTGGAESFFGVSVHRCGSDVYHSRIDLRADGTWGLRHAVEGPRKGYSSVTTYRPAWASRVVWGGAMHRPIRGQKR